MEGFWLISYLALWTLTLLLAVVILAHSRLLGLLHHRFGPARARPLADGPKLGARLKRLSGRRVDGSAWAHTFPAEADLIVVFISPQCQTCNELMPHAKDFVRAHPDVPLVLLSTLGDLAMNRAYVGFLRLERLTYVVAPQAAGELNVEGTPYALHLDREGTVTAKGLVNAYEQLVSLRQSAAFDGPVPAEVEPELGSQTGSIP
jgi:methylamine dehydrogenase accessory protein MauD